MSATIRLRRAYDPPQPDDGLRVLVDRLWPRGLRREGAKIDLWDRDVAPSSELRRWFGHDPARFAAFRRRYLAELDQSADALDELAARAAEGRLTLLYAARDTEHNHAIVLAEALAAASGRRLEPE